MKLNFFKTHVCGNDYIYLDLNNNCPNFVKKNAPSIAKRLSQNHFSIGADGLVLIDKENDDYKMTIYNRDGTLAKMCGNALCSVGWYLLNKYGKNSININTDSGFKRVFLDVKRGKDYVIAQMDMPKICPYKAHQIYNKNKCKYVDMGICHTFIDVGNLHLVILQKTLDNGLIAPLLTKTDHIFDGINVEFCHIDEKGQIFVKVYERGCGETLCCGTGAVATFCFLNKMGYIANQALLNFSGGKAFVFCDDKNVYLSQKVDFVFKGEVDFD